MRTTITLPDPLLRTAKRRAADLHVTLSEVIEDALRASFFRAASQAVPPFQLHTVHGRLVQPGLDLDRTSALLALDDELQFNPQGQGNN